MKTLLIIGSIFFLSACSIVGPGERGLRVSLGEVSNDIKQPGVYLWVPVLYGMKKIDVQIQRNDIEASAASKDMQEISTHVAVNYTINSEMVVETYKKIGDEDAVLERVIKPAVNEVMKSVVATRTAEEVLTKRLEMKKDIQEYTLKAKAFRIKP